MAIRRQPDPRARWQAAQQAELDFWRSWRSIATFHDFDPRAYWERQFRRLLISDAVLRSQTVVEVGCGPFGGIFYLPPCKQKVGVDPLAGKFAIQTSPSVSQPSADVYLLRAIGEHLPLRDACADLVI